MLRNEFYIQGDEDVQVPAHLNFGKFMLDRLRRMNDTVALQDGETGESLTYKELTQYAVDLAVSLSGLGIGKAVLKHCMSVAKPTHFILSKQFWDKNRETLLDYGSIKTYISFDGGPDSAISISSLIENHIDVDKFEPADVKGQIDAALILYSSGTTGMPKGIEITHLNFILNCSTTDFKDSIFKTIFLASNWFHILGILITYKFISMGKKVVYSNDHSPKGVLQCMQDYKVDVGVVRPSVVSLISMLDENEEYNLETLKYLYCSTFPIHVKTMEKALQRFPQIKNIIQIYIMTEFSSITTEFMATKGPRPGSVGQVFPGVTIKVVDPHTEKPLGPNEHGEIRVKGPFLMKGYIGIDPDTYLDAEGFFKTGDLGYYDDDKYFFIVDRLKEIINNNGLKIAPVELEAILLLHPTVRDAAVVGKPDPIFGEACAAFVVKKTGSDITEQQLIDYFSPQVNSQMQLTGGLKFIPQIPRSLTGKILRRNLRDLLKEKM